jgi:hypothetical protein
VAYHCPNDGTCDMSFISRTEDLVGLAAAGFVDVSVRFTHQAADGMYCAIIQAKPITASAAATTSSATSAGSLTQLSRGGPALRHRAIAELVGTAFLVTAVVGSRNARLSLNDVGASASVPQ